MEDDLPPNTPPSTSHCSPPTHHPPYNKSPHHLHRRSASWNPPRASCSPPSSQPCPHTAWPQPFCLQVEPSNSQLSDLQRRNKSSACPPLQFLSASRKHPSASTDRSRLIGKMKDLKLDLDAVGRASHDQDEAQGGDRELQQRKERMAECDKECSRILSYLFLGGKTVAQSLATLRGCRITHILNCVGFVCPEYFPNDFYYKTLWLQDSPNEDIFCVLYDVFDYIEKVREQSGGRVFVHCSQGVSRSAALAIAYLMWRKHESFEDAYEKVKRKRSVVSPNMGFVAQLMQLQRKILNSPDRQAFQVYRIAPHSAFDPLYLVPKNVSSPRMQALDSRGAFVIHLANLLYVWRGRRCDKEMAAVADRAAFQLVRYERAQGPVTSVSEGSEPSQMLKAFGELSDQGSGEGAVQPGESEEEMTEKCIAGYDSDYEMYRKAKAGGYVPPVVGSGVIIRLPARERWSQLREYFFNSPRRLSEK